MRHSFIEALLPQPRHNRLSSYQHSALPIDPPPTTLQGISVILPFNQTIPLYWGWWKSSVIIQCKQLLAQIVIVSCYKLRLISLYVWVMILKRDGKWQITSLWLTECQLFFLSIIYCYLFLWQVCFYWRETQYARQLAVFVFTPRTVIVNSL